MKLIVGLGNPGKEYLGTRHNVGFGVVDALANRHGGRFAAAKVDGLIARLRLPADDVLLLKPLTYMNLSGPAVQGVAHYFKIDVPDILIVTDDVNLPLGRLRIRRGGTDGGHNGLRSVALALGTTEYPRLRIGVGRGSEQRDLADHVLSRFDEEERPGIDAAIARAADAAEAFVTSDIESVMNVYNRDPDPPGGSGPTVDT